MLCIRTINSAQSDEPEDWIDLDCLRLLLQKGTTPPLLYETDAGRNPIA
jgi:hypothetical protein